MAKTYIGFALRFYLAYEGRYVYFRFDGCHLGLRCGFIANNMGISTTEKVDLENMRVALGILFLRGFKIKIYITRSRKLPVTGLNLRLPAAIVDFMINFNNL
jgi:hypothetical protein